MEEQENTKISYDDFSKIDMRVGTILKVEDHPNADKLYVLKVDLGEENPRTICAGIKSFYKKEELEGMQAVFIANLQPRMLRGVESNGMILAASTKNHEKVILVSPKDRIEEGSKLS